jgi:hypothetical protein
VRLDRHLAPKISRMDGGFQKTHARPKIISPASTTPPKTLAPFSQAARFLDAASACLLVCGGLSGDAGALAIRSAEQPGGWGQCGGVLLRHEPPSHPRTQRMKIGFRITTAARKTSSAQGAIIAAETAAPRGCWPRDPRSGVGDKLR